MLASGVYGTNVRGAHESEEAARRASPNSPSAARRFAEGRREQEVVAGREPRLDARVEVAHRVLRIDVVGTRRRPPHLGQRPRERFDVVGRDRAADLPFPVAEVVRER